MFLSQRTQNYLSRFQHYAFVLEIEQDYRILKGTQISYLNYCGKKSDEHWFFFQFHYPYSFLPFLIIQRLYHKAKRAKKNMIPNVIRTKKIFTFTFSIPFTVIE